jgi:hypothetical protein
MKAFLITASAVVLGGTALLMAQNTLAPNAQVMGRGRGGAPYAWNDKNKDGLCDLTGAPVGQGRGAGGMRAGRRGRGANAGWGRGMGRAAWSQQQAQPQAAPAPVQK